MFQFAFEGALFKFEAKTPAGMPLFTLPPQLSARTPEGERNKPAQFTLPVPYLLFHLLLLY